MELISLHCPNCGAPVTLGENVLAVVCAYCRAQIQRQPDETAQLTAALADGRRALRLTNYEEAGLHFAEAVSGAPPGDPRKRDAWLFCAAAAVLADYRDPREAQSFWQAAGYTAAEASARLAGPAGESPRLLHDLLRRHVELLQSSPELAEGLLAGALAATPKDVDQAGLSFTAAAELAWQKGHTERAVALMRRALELDPEQQPVNKWLLELARKKI